ncbi:alpha/beta hydrolase [Streptomyces sp. NPDC002669]|uniref:alpha/beta hydrolase n=1 Tax=Streptomyces sp. NPDC002669 TaxID=3364658 RepID=UPI00368686CC
MFSKRAQLIAHQVPTDAKGAVLVLPGGSMKSKGRYFSIVELGLRPLLARLAEQEGLAVYLLRYRVRGWNGDDADSLADTRWALDEIVRLHGQVPVALVGNSLGGRAAYHAAGHPSVVSVTGIAPALPSDDPVTQLAGRQCLILHGDKDHSEASAAMSLAYARRAHAITTLARFEIPGAGHFLLRGSRECYMATTEFVTATLARTPLPPLIAQAQSGDLCSPLPLDV